MFVVIYSYKNEKIKKRERQIISSIISESLETLFFISLIKNIDISQYFSAYFLTAH